MATTSEPSLPFFSLLILATALFSITTVAEIRSSDIRSDDRPAIPLDEFGFTHSGLVDLNVSQISLSIPNPNLKFDPTGIGFFLCTPDSWFHVLRQIQAREIQCPLNSNLIKLIYTFDRLKDDHAFNTTLQVTDPNQYTLLLGNCISGVRVSMNVRSAMYNTDPKSGRRDYLSAGKTTLPRIYFFFFLIYSSLAGIWTYILYNKQPVAVFRIHFFMLAVVILKALNLLCEAEDKSYVKRTGSAHGWDVLFYIFSFLKGITLFTLIVLIGTGWSFLKPYLQDREKKVVMIVIPLQVVANVAGVVIDETGPYGNNTYAWRQLFLLVDIVCCCAVLFPIVWSIKNLREAARTDGKAAVNLMKLTLFRHYYIVVICYIYFTRVVVYGLETITSYRYQWTSVVAAELVTVAFYVFTGYSFRPKVHNPYFVLDDEEEEAAAEALKLEEDEFEL